MNLVNKIFFGSYVLAAALFAFLHLSNVNFKAYLFYVLFDLILVLAIFYLLKVIIRGSFEAARFVICTFFILICLFLIYLTWVFSSMSGYQDSYCYEIKAKNVFTGEEKLYCEIPPWYTQIDSKSLGDSKLISSFESFCRRYHFTALENVCNKVSLFYISCGCGCCSFDDPLEKIAEEKCLYRSKGESLEDKILQDKQLSPQACALRGCSRPVKYIYCD